MSEELVFFKSADENIVLEPAIKDSLTTASDGTISKPNSATLNFLTMKRDNIE